MDYIFIENKNTLDYIKESDNLERIIVLDFNQFWNSIEKSFRDSDDIFTQFSVDIVRCNFFVNTCPINDSNQVKLYLRQNISSETGKRNIDVMYLVR